MLLWVRRIGKEWNHDLYRTTDGVTFTLVATLKLAVQPMQITDVFAVPEVGLMALWFAGNYSDEAVHSWGMMTSSDDGATWTREQTNIGDILASTPSLILDAETGLLSNYYYERGRGILRRRVVEPDVVFDNPLHWPASEAVTLGSPITWDSGNANATVIGDNHYVSFYSGKAPDTAVMVSELPEPTVGDVRASTGGSKR